MSSTRSLRTVLLFFVRWPVPGSVKTRLARSIGPAEAASVYKTLAEHCFREVLACGREMHTVVYATGAPPEAFRGWLPGAGGYWVQPTGDLGLRLKHGFRRASQELGADRILAIGSDCPHLQAPRIRQASEHLADRHVTIVPAHDGGYALIGTRGVYTDLFEGIDWSTEDVLRQTLDTCARRRLAVWQGTPLYDIDTIEDWEQYTREGASTGT